MYREQVNDVPFGLEIGHFDSCRCCFLEISCDLSELETIEVKILAEAFQC